MRCLKTTLLLLLVCVAQTQTTRAQDLVVIEGKPTITELSDVLWTPSLVLPRPKVVYGEDDRIDVYQETDSLKRTWAASTCALVYTARLTQHSDGSYTITSPSEYRRYGLPACPGEPFGAQPTAAYCSAFMVGPDLIATAGHCFNSSSLPNSRFIFGFSMTDEDTPRLTFLKQEVYQGVEILSSSPSGTYDHCLIRVDRPITAPGAKPFKIRRDGLIQPGEFVGVIGHPSGLPMKLAFGNTYVRRSEDAGFFVANLDTYGGNSGSPVINQGTGILEGILVRGETDFLNMGTCFESYVAPNDGGRGEDVTKTSAFASFVPDTGGTSGFIALDGTDYDCAGTIGITVIDADLLGMNMIAVEVDVSNGDSESVALVEDAESLGYFNGVITAGAGSPQADSGALEIGHGDIISAVYYDDENESGEPAVVEDTALVDCYSPAIQAVAVAFLGGTQAQIQFETDEPAQGVVRYGLSCGSLSSMATGAVAADHSISLNGLSPETEYFFLVEARDPAGNAGVDDNGGDCYSFTTYSTQNHFTEYFNSVNPVDVEYRQATYIPVDHPNRYQACVSTVTELPVPPSGSVLPLGDDDFEEVALPQGRTLKFYDNEYESFFVGSNGYITFREGDASYQSQPSQHFLLPRISGLMCDLNPELRGNVYLAELSDRYVVTFDGVPRVDLAGQYPPENNHVFQTELFLNGIIRITWLEAFTNHAVTGLSAGAGAPANFTSIKITGYPDCADVSHEGVCHSADTNRDWRISLSELLRMIQLYNSAEISCEPMSPDGYQAGSGPIDCEPHDSDYVVQDWRINMSELLRLIQFYNARGYQPSADSEDGFQAVP